jgi:hypothetical protein
MVALRIRFSAAAYIPGRKRTGITSRSHTLEYLYQHVIIIGQTSRSKAQDTRNGRRRGASSLGRYSGSAAGCEFTLVTMMSGANLRDHNRKASFLKGR